MSLIDKIKLEQLLIKLFPLPRSITGDGLRESFNILKEYIDFKLEEIPTGYKADEWQVPKEWTVNNLCLLDKNKTNLIDYKSNNLHVVNYSESLKIDGKLEDIQDYIYTAKHMPDSIPYVTSYYSDLKGICISENLKNKLVGEELSINLETSFFDGSMTFGETVLEGRDQKEVNLTSYMCHPSMGNNELSGPLVLSLLYQLLQRHDRKFTYRFSIFPETIGAITYIKKNYERLKKRTVYGLVLTCLGGPIKNISYKMGKNTKIKNIFQEYLISRGDVIMRPFDPTEGSNERHFCFPTVDLPFGQFGRTLYTKYPEYHNSADDIAFTDVNQIMNSAKDIYQLLIDFEDQYVESETTIEPSINIQSTDSEDFFIPKAKYGEPFLTKHNLYPKANVDGTNFTTERDFTNKILNILSMSDGFTSKQFISNKFNIEDQIFDTLLENNILIKV